MAKALPHRTMTSLAKILVAVMLATVFAGVLQVRPAHAFTIGVGDIFNPWQSYPSLKDEERHELITLTAVITATPMVTPNWTPGVNFATDLIRGVQNTDITHQWDCDSHFDNSTVRLPVPTASQDILCTDGKGNYSFDAGFATLRQRLQVAFDYAKGNPQFLNPSFIRLSDVVEEIRTTLFAMVNDQACTDALACPQTRLLPVRAELALFADALLLNPNPDPDTADGGTSPFNPNASTPNATCQVLCAIGRFAAPKFTTIAPTTLDRLNEVLGPHSEPPLIGCGCQKTLAEALGSDHPLVKQLENERDEVRAYLAFQELGHVFHTTEDFFAHTNYINLMASGLSNKTIGPGDDISAMTNIATNALPVPTSYDDFTLAGIRSLLSQNQADDGNLQSGAVVTSWLGEGDYCGSAHDELFNPTVSYFFAPKYPSILGIPLGTLQFAGNPNANPGPPPGFDYCHYETATTMGLNKDDPNSGEHQQVNHFYAFSAAERTAEALWRQFLGNLTPTTSVTSNPAPAADGTISAHQATLTFTATDSSGKGIKSITYAAAGANPIAANTVSGASAQITISNPGDTYVAYSATDNAGVQEPFGEYVVKLRSTAANPMYDYKIIASSSSATGTSAFRSLGIGPSVNDWGEVAFTGSTDAGSGIYLADATGHVRAVNPGWSTNFTRRFEDTVTVTNGDAIAVGDRVSGAPPSYRVRIWDARPGVIDTYQTLDVSGAGQTSAATVIFDPGNPGVPAAGIAGMMIAQPAGFYAVPGSYTPGAGFASVVTPTMSDTGRVAWAGLDPDTNNWVLASGVAGDVSTSAGQMGAGTGPVRQSVTDDYHIVARASGDGPSTGEPIWAADAPIVMWDINYGSAQTIVCQSGCAHPGFTAIGRFVGASDDSAVIAFAATGPQGTGIYASVRTQIGTALTPDARVVVPIVITSSTGPISAIEGAFKIAVNSTQKSGERAVELAFMADSANNDKGLWVSRLRFPGNPDGTYDSEHLPSLPQADPPQMVVQQGSTLPGLPGTISDVWYYDPINNRNSGDLAFWVGMVGGTQAIVRARPQCGSTDYAPGTEVDSQYINQYDAGTTLNMIKAYGQAGGNACGPTSLSMAINNIQHARGQARTGKMANLISLYGDGTTSCVVVPFMGGYCTYNGVMIRDDGQNIPIQDNYKVSNGPPAVWAGGAVYDRSRAEAILSSAGWTYQDTQGIDELNAALDAGKQVVQSTVFGTNGQGYGSTGLVTGKTGGGHMVLFSGRTPMGDYIVEDPAGDYFQNPTQGGSGAHYGPGICGKYTVYAKSTVAENLKLPGDPKGRYGLALGYKQNVDPDVLLVQAFPTGSTGRSFTMWVTDSSGHQSGFPTGEGSPISAIPNSTASLDALSVAAPDAGSEEDIPTSKFPYAVLIVNPPADLQVHVAGQAASSSYTLQYTRFTGGQQTSSDQVTGIVAAGESKTTPIVRAPIATAQTVQARQETPKAIQLGGTDPAGRSLTFAIATPPANGSLSSIDATGNVVYAPVSGYTGPDSFTFTVSNGVIVSRPATVGITVNTNAPPIASDVSVSTDENVGAQVTLAGSAPSGQPTTFAASQPANGFVTVTGGTASYTPKQYFYGTDSFTYTVSDGYLTSTTATVTVTVRHVNQPPIVVVSAPQSVNEGAAPVPITASVSDPDGDTFTLQWTNSLGNLVTNGSSATFSADDGPATATVTLTATDSHGAATVVNATILVNNVAPTVTSGLAQTQFWGLPVTLTGNATDPSAADTAAGLHPTWTFGDGPTTASGFSVAHTYANPGSYAAKLTATDKDGGAGSATVGVTVNKRGSSVSYTGTTSAGYGFVTLSAKLTDLVDGPSARLAGHRVTFLVGTQAFGATTDSTGTATVIPAPIAPGSYQVAVSFPADTLYLGSSAKATLVISNTAGSATGTSLVPASGGTASFNITSTGTTISGTLDYANGSTVVHATSLAPFGIRADAHAAWFNGVDTLSRKITVYVEDTGVFKLSINGVVQTGSGALASGTIQVVKS